MKPQNLEPLALPVKAAAAFVGLGRTKLLELEAIGAAPKAHFVGRKKLFLVSDLRAWAQDGFRRPEGGER